MIERGSDVFFNPDEDPIFDKPVYLDETAFSQALKVNANSIEMSKTPTILPTWSLVDSQGAKENWRPSGWQIISGNDGLLYVLMQKNGFPGSHKSGGEEVWVFDPSQKKRIRRILLNSPGFSIEVTPEVTLTGCNWYGYEHLDLRYKWETTTQHIRWSTIGNADHAERKTLRIPVDCRWSFNFGPPYFGRTVFKRNGL